MVKHCNFSLYVGMLEQKKTPVKSSVSLAS